jgi:hypothetical protein
VGAKRTFGIMRATIVVAGLVTASLVRAEPADKKVGELTCGVASGFGYIFGSSRKLHCTFRVSGHPDENYEGTLNKFGIDVGYNAGGVVVWSVFSASSDLAAGALSGTYTGATANATVGVGLGANVLVGGSNRAIVLQPFAIGGNKGLDVAAGVGSITIEPAP